MAEEKKKKKKVSIVEIILYAVGGLLLMFSVCYGVLQYLENKASDEKMDDLRDKIGMVSESPMAEENQEEQVEEYVSPYAAIFAMNDDMKAWIKIPGTRIDYPIMQTTQDEMFYLHTDFYGNYDKNGTLFFAAGDQVETEKSDNLVIYGHNMRSGAMFGDLDYYKKVEYKDEHPYIYLYFKDEEWVFEIISASRHKALNKTQKGFRYYAFYDADSEEEWQDFCSNITAANIYGTTLEAHEGDHLVTLSTCAPGGKSNRFVIVGKRIDPDQVK